MWTASPSGSLEASESDSTGIELVGFFFFFLEVEDLEAWELLCDSEGKKTPLHPMLGVPDPIGTLLQSLLPPLCAPNDEEGEGVLIARMRDRELVMETQRMMEMQSFLLFSCTGKIVSFTRRSITKWIDRSTV